MNNIIFVTFNLFNCFKNIERYKLNFFFANNIKFIRVISLKSNFYKNNEVLIINIILTCKL